MINLQRLLQDGSVDAINEDEWATWRIAISFSAAALCLIMSAISIFVIVTIVRNPDIRSFTFHIYVVFILAPDAFLNAVDGTQSIYRGIYDGVGPTGLCFARNFFLIFYYYSNICVNACVANEVYFLICTGGPIIGSGRNHPHSERSSCRWEFHMGLRRRLPVGW